MTLSHNQRISALEGGNVASDKVAFRVSGGTSQNQSLTVGSVLAFTEQSLCIPSGSFSSATYKFTVPIKGVYQIGFKLYQNSSDNNMRISLHKNNSSAGIAGAKGDAAENLTTILECDVGDEFHVECVFGSGNIFMGLNHSWFYGNLLFKN